MTLEVDATRAEVARVNLARAGLASLVQVRVGRAVDTLSALVDENAGPFDLVFIDADKTSNPEYLTWAMRLSRPGTLIVADNVVRAGAVADPASDDESVKGIRRFLERVAAAPRLAATAIQTVGSKGWDGVAIVLALM